MRTKKLTLFFLSILSNICIGQNIVIKYIGDTDERIHLMFDYRETNTNMTTLSAENRYLILSSNKPVTISCFDVTRRTLIYAEPNDTIEIKIDDSGLINYSSKKNPYRKLESEFINQIYKNFGPTEKADNKRISKLLLPKELKQSTYIDEDYVKEQELLDSSQKENIISNEFYEYFKSIYWSLTLSNRLLHLPIKEETYTTIEKSFKNNQDLMNIPEYRILLLDYTKTKINKSDTNSDLFNTLKFITEKYVDQSIIDYLLYFEMKIIFNDHSKKNSIDKESINLLNEHCKNVIFREEIEKELIPSYHASGLLNDILKKHKGKLVLIDFWASWCFPCREEFPFEKKLMSKYRQMSFIFISIDKSIAAWQNASKQYSDMLNKDNSILLNESSLDEISKKINIKTIPRFVLFDKEGKIIDSDAPRPSTKDIEILIEKYL